MKKVLATNNIEATKPIILIGKGRERILLKNVFLFNFGEEKFDFTGLLVSHELLTLSN